jgi:RHS repeat-associated protein
MVRTESLLPDRQRALEERLCLRKPAPGIIEDRQVVEARGHLGVIRPESLLHDRERALEERLRPRVSALGSVKLSEVGQALGHIGVIGAERLLPDRDRARVVQLRIREPALDKTELGQTAQARGHLGMIRPESFLPDRQRTLEERLRFRVPVFVATKKGEVGQALGYIEVIRTEGPLPDRQRALEERLAAAKKDSAGSSETNPQEGGIPQTTPPGESGGAMSTLTSARAGTYYIYSFDGRLLAEYDIYGICLKEYIYMGSRLIAEYNPATSQYHYYTQDRIRSTRIVTDDTGTVVYAAGHDPYGGIQKVWLDDFDPKRKFSDKERDGETGLDYFGARFYSAPRYRWLSADPALYLDVAIKNPQAWNLYSFCRNNPTSFIDPTGQIVYADEGAFARIKDMFGVLGVLLTRDADGRLHLAHLSAEAKNTIEKYAPELVFWINAIKDESTVFYVGEGSVVPTSKGDISMGDEIATNLTAGNEWRLSAKRPPVQYDAVIVINPCATPRIGGWENKLVSLNAILYHEFAEAYANLKFGWYRYPMQGFRNAETGHYWAGQMEMLMLKNNPDFTACPAGSGCLGPFSNPDLSKIRN